jgi:hypothetical protein
MITGTEGEWEIRVTHRCTRMGEHWGDDPLPTPCPDCYAVETRSRRVPYSVLADAEAAHRARFDRTA